MARAPTPAPAGEPCPPEDLLFAYAAGAVEPAEFDRLLRHIDACASCRYLLAEASRAFDTHPPPDAPPVIHTLKEGDLLLDRYLIRRFLAQGGMGEVYLAEDQLLEEPVALKTLSCTALDDPRAAFRFKAETRLARRVTHPNVCRILEFGLHVRRKGTSRPESIPFLTMEFLDGETVAGRVAGRGRLREIEAAPLILQVMAGLQAIHAAGIIHRDFKSENVFLVPQPGGAGAAAASSERALVMDFGLARAVDGSVVSTWPLDRVLAGTIDTMAPEQIEGRAPEPTVDVYAMGVFLFEILTGRRPFINVPVINRLHERAPTPSSVVGRTLTPGWDALIGRCLERDPQARFRSLGELSIALNKQLRPVLIAG